MRAASRWFRSGWERPAALLLAAACLAPFLVLLVELVGQQWYPAGDRSLIELRVRDVGANTPLVGPYSRYGWSHPGPAMYWLWAIPYRLTGSTPVSLLIATAVINAGSVAAMLWIAWRRGRLVLLALTSAVLATLISSVGSQFLVDPWNPFITVLPVGLFVMVTWATVDGERWALPATVGVGTFLVQSHVGYLAIVGVGALWVAVPRLLEWWRAGHARPEFTGITAPGRLAWALGVFLWAPVVWDQVLGSGNLSKLVDYFTSSEDPAVGLGYGAGLAAREVELGAPWMSGTREPVRIDGGVEATGLRGLWLVLLLLAVGGALSWWASRRTELRPDRSRGAALLAGVVASMVVAGVIAVARINEVAFDYLVRWWWALAAVTLLAVAWAFWNAVPPAIGRRLGPVAVGVLALLVGSHSIDSVRSASDLALLEPEFAGPVSQIAGPTVDALTRGRAVRVASAGSGPGSVTDGVRLQLERGGIPTLVSPDDGYKFGEHRSTDSTAPTATVWVVSGDELRSWMERTDMEFVTLADPMSPDERDLWSAEARALADQFEAAGHPELVDALYADDSLYYARDVPEVDKELLSRVDEGRRRGRPYAVFIGEATLR